MAEPRFVVNEVTSDLYRNFTITFPGGSLTATKDVLMSIFKNDQLPSTCNPETCLLYTSPSPRDGLLSRMPSSA